MRNSWGTRDQGRVLSAVQERILREQDVDEDGPGTVLRDFNALLSFIEEEQPIRVTDKLRLLPLRALPEVNARMAHPLQLGLQRPQHRSFPHIHGLYLLVRASGLTRVREDGKRPRLVVDEEVQRVWLATAVLNLVEFTHDHLYWFSYRNRFGAFGHIYHPYMDDGPWADEVRIGELPLGVGQEMT